jgi:hypothetical protein
MNTCIFKYYNYHMGNNNSTILQSYGQPPRVQMIDLREFEVVFKKPLFEAYLETYTMQNKFLQSLKKWHKDNLSELVSEAIFLFTCRAATYNLTYNEGKEILDALSGYAPHGIGNIETLCAGNTLPNSWRSNKFFIYYDKHWKARDYDPTIDYKSKNWYLVHKVKLPNKHGVEKVTYLIKDKCRPYNDSIVRYSNKTHHGCGCFYHAESIIDLVIRSVNATQKNTR